MSLFITPISFEEANAFVALFHRHHKPVTGMKFCIAVADESNRIRGVAIVGRPVARALDNGWTLEVNRCCTDGAKNACSMLYGHCWKIAKLLGYKKIITYTLPEEGGASLRATGWIPVVGVGGTPWNHKTRIRSENPHSDNKIKTRWEASLPMPDNVPPFVDVANALHNQTNLDLK